MRLGRTIPPAAAPVRPQDLLHGLCGVLFGKRYLDALEAELRQYVDVRHVFLVSSGKAALTLILLALKSLSARRDAVIPAYTCYSVPSAVVKAGLKVTPCDVDPETLDFDYARLEAVLGENTLCVVPTHLFGVPADVSRVQSLCEARGIFVVEDAAQAMGGTSRGRKLGTLGDVGFFSLGRGKNITCGAGGIIVTTSDRIAAAIARLHAALGDRGIIGGVKPFLQVLLMAVFIRPALYWIPAALPFLKLGQTCFDTDFPMRRLSGLQAGLLRHWRSRLAESNQVRAATAADLGNGLQSVPPVRRAIAYLRLPVLVQSREERDRLLSRSHELGLGVSLMYPGPVTEIAELKAECQGSRCPSASRLADRLVTLPTHHLLADRDKQTLRELLRGSLPATPRSLARS